MSRKPISDEYPQIDPSDCDGNCEICPIDESCDHVRLTDSQVFSAMVCGCGIFIFLTAGVIGITVMVVNALLEKL